MMPPTLNVRNPRTGQHDYSITPPEATTIATLGANLRTAQVQWQHYGVEYRVGVLGRWCEAVERHKPALQDALIADTGRKWESVLEVDLLFSSIDRWCKLGRDFFAEPAAKLSSVPFVEIRQDMQPFPLVGVISPWNFPLLLSLIDAIPALVAGCAVIVKPSEITPRFIKPLMDSIREVPELASVLVYVEGTAETGVEIIKNIDLVCFTGSVATGRSVYRAAAEQFIPAFLELGGKDAALVFEGANLDHATSSLLWGATANAGQSCLSIERIYVQESIFEEFIAMLAEKANKLSFCYPDVNNGEIGPIISAKQAEIIDNHLRDATAKGAQILTGVGQCEEISGGIWCFPTVLTNVNHTMKVMTEETFGPLMPVMPFKSEDEAITFANSSIFGLSGAVFARTHDEAHRIGKRMQAGAISLNDSALTAIIHDGEKQAFKFSGIGGTRMGASAMKRFIRQRAFLTKTKDVVSPWWY